MFESQFFKLFILLLIGLFFLALLAFLSFTFNRNRDLKGCLVPLLFIALLAAAIVVVLDPEKLVECAFKPPEQIRMAGHITPKNNSQANDFLVLLYKGDEEVARYITRSGRLPSEEEDRDGYFELTALNEVGLTRCSAAVEFEQDRSGFDMLWMRNKTTYLWGNFSGLEPGAHQTLNNNEPRKTYRLVVLPSRLNRYPREIRLYATYLDSAGNPAINAPVPKYKWDGNAFAATPMGFYIHPGRLPDTPQWQVHPLAREVKYAWVEYDKNPSRMEIRILQDTRIVERNNCNGEQPRTDPGVESIIWIKEVQFLESPNLDFDLGIAASRAAESLGFTHGQMGTYTFSVPVYVPAGTHRNYKLFWREVWRTGTMVIDSGSENIEVAFREKIGMSQDVEPYDVDCP